MYIKSVILDGFKSYGSRVEVHGFDPEFNAITGLNGTGKSNILDSICFVLGITNLTHVRATSLQDLIYKNGQAGVTKASVSIVFDNTDTAKSPLTYEHCREITVTRQIVVSGKNRYMINGSNVNNKQIADFFNSVHLNVNNPHFLIMQGRITKVLNMKPPEILSMIEEAAGTRMYENKKQQAQKTIEKKDKKLKEMDDMLAEQIEPKLNRLVTDRKDFNDYNTATRQYEGYKKILTAWYYYESDKKHEEAKQNIAKTTESLKNLDDDLLKQKQSLIRAEEKISQLETLRDQEKGGDLQELENDLKEKEKEEGKVKSQFKAGQESVSTEISRKKKLEKNLKDDIGALETKKKEMDKAKDIFDLLRKAEQSDAEALAAAEKKLQAVCSGLLSNEDGEDATLHDQLMMAKEQLTKVETEVKTLNMELEHHKKDLKTKEPMLAKNSATFQKDRSEIKSKEKEQRDLKQSLLNLKYEDGLLEKLQQELGEANNNYRRAKHLLQQFEGRYHNLSFNYAEPEPNFKHRVKGRICSLIKPKDPKYSRAIEAAAGGRLYNVVVDNDLTVSKLLKARSAGDQRITYAPLSKIVGSRLPANVVSKANEIAGNKGVHLAIDLIEFDPVLEPVMAYVFGQTLISEDNDSAMEICFNRQVNRKTITLDGDVYDPAGVISGGAIQKSEPVLSAVEEMKKLESEVEVYGKKIIETQRKIADVTSAANEFENKKQKLKLCEMDLSMLKVRVENTPHFKLQKEVDELKEAIESKNEKLNQIQIDIKEKRNKVAGLEDKVKNFAAIRDKEKKEAEDELKKMRKKAHESRSNWKKREQEFECLNLEIQELEKLVESHKTEIQKTDEAVYQFKEESEKLKSELANIQTFLNEAKARVKEKKIEINKKDKEIQELVSTKESILKGIGTLEQGQIKMKNVLSQYEKALLDNAEYIKQMQKNHEWIANDKEFFGQKGGVYDFEKNNPDELRRTCKELESIMEKGKHLDKKALDALSHQENRYQDVLEKKSILEEDRYKILSVIGTLDGKKVEIIRNAWERVNHDFNSILSSLLPGAQAKLKPPDGKDFMAGLEVKVGFGGIWKEGLDELSGGQRSLVALSLILAMLLFNPAPLYILDEVDAALDLSHTQNIGQMLKAHFKQSQFIVVSLKDGMFNNANVLFKTSFVDGMSNVIRTCNVQPS